MKYLCWFHFLNKNVGYERRVSSVWYLYVKVHKSGIHQLKNTTRNHFNAHWKVSLKKKRSCTAVLLTINLIYYAYYFEVNIWRSKESLRIYYVLLLKWATQLRTNVSSTYTLTNTHTYIHTYNIYLHHCTFPVHEHQVICLVILQSSLYYIR